jgi:hypothetical protein
MQDKLRDVQVLRGVWYHEFRGCPAEPENYKKCRINDLAPMFAPSKAKGGGRPGSYS